MKKSLFSLFVVVLVMTDFAHSICCRKTHIKFHITGGGVCGDIEGGQYPVPTGYGTHAVAISGSQIIGNIREGNCRIFICGNGRKSRYAHCGQNVCNIFGCACDGGCIPGDAIQNFKNLHGNKVSSVYEA